MRRRYEVAVSVVLAMAMAMAMPVGASQRLAPGVDIDPPAEERASIFIKIDGIDGESSPSIAIGGEGGEPVGQAAKGADVFLEIEGISGDDGRRR